MKMTKQQAQERKEQGWNSTKYETDNHQGAGTYLVRPGIRGKKHYNRILLAPRREEHHSSSHKAKRSKATNNPAQKSFNLSIS